MFEPKNEQGVIVAFMQLADKYGYEISRIGAAFPDAEIYDRAQDKYLRVEFEYSASCFVEHGHDPSGCDLIICWRNNWKQCPLPVFELLALDEYAEVREKLITRKRRIYVEKVDPCSALTSAVRICREAGIPIQYAKQDGILYLIVPGGVVVPEGDGVTFRYVETS